MATKNLSKEEKLTAEQKMIGSVSNFFQKNRILVIVLAAVIVVGLIAAIVVVNSVNNAKEKAQLKINTLEESYAEQLAAETPEWSTLETELKAMVKGEMEHVITLKVPLTVECNDGTNWLEAH